jgi:PIN domain nuclease of toxin-antitoxin system
VLIVQNVLLDTNALVFYVSGASRFGRKSIKVLDNWNLFYSPLSLVELRLKAERGKFRGAIRSEDLNDLGLNELTLSSRVEDHLVSLSTADPFDRTLVAQAKAAGFSFMTSDSAILDSDLAFVLDLAD